MMYCTRLENDLSLWVEKGLIDQNTASCLLEDYDDRLSSFRFSHALIIIAAILIGSSILLLIASNWEAIPRLARILGMISLIWFLHLAGAAFLKRGANKIGVALLLLGTISFGGTISLVGQMYHLSGDESDVIFIWFLMTVLSALLFRSSALTGFAAVLSWAYLFYSLSNTLPWYSGRFWSVFIFAIAVIALSHYSRAYRLRHSGCLLLLAWLAWIVIDSRVGIDFSSWLALIYVFCGMASFIALTLPALNKFLLIEKVEAIFVEYSYLLCLLGILLLHFEIYDDIRFYYGYDNLYMVIKACIAILTFCICLLGIFLKGKDNILVRYFAYSSFALEIIYLAYNLAGSMKQTSAFFLMCGLVIALLAFLVVKLEKRFAQRLVGASTS